MRVTENLKNNQLTGLFIKNGTFYWPLLGKSSVMTGGTHKPVSFNICLLKRNPRTLMTGVCAAAAASAALVCRLPARLCWSAWACSSSCSATRTAWWDHARRWCRQVSLCAACNHAWHVMHTPLQRLGEQLHRSDCGNNFKQGSHQDQSPWAPTMIEPQKLVNSNS